MKKEEAGGGWPERILPRVVVVCACREKWSRVGRRQGSRHRIRAPLRQCVSTLSIDHLSPPSSSRFSLSLSLHMPPLARLRNIHSCCSPRAHTRGPLIARARTREAASVCSARETEALPLMTLTTTYRLRAYFALPLFIDAKVRLEGRGSQDNE